MSEQYQIDVIFDSEGCLQFVNTTRTLDGVGPQIEFWPSGDPRAFFANVAEGEACIGTKTYWTEYGGRHRVEYIPPADVEANITLDFLAHWTELFDGNLRWHADFLPIQSEKSASGGQQVTLLDPKAESQFKSRRRRKVGPNVVRDADGNIRVYESYDLDLMRFGLQLTFWPNGVLRTICEWSEDGILGTRSCFAKNAELLAEQMFPPSGWNHGNWINRYFKHANAHTMLDRIEVFRDFRQIELINPDNFSVFDEARINQMVDPNFEALLEAIPSELRR